MIIVVVLTKLATRKESYFMFKNFVLSYNQLLRPETNKLIEAKLFVQNTRDNF